MFIHVYIPLATGWAEPVDCALRSVCTDLFTAAWYGRGIKVDDIDIVFTEPVRVRRPAYDVFVHVEAEKREQVANDHNEIAHQVAKRATKHLMSHHNITAVVATSIIWVDSYHGAAP